MSRVVWSNSEPVDPRALLGLVARVSERRQAEADEQVELAATGVSVATQVILRLQQALDEIAALHRDTLLTEGPYCLRCGERGPCGTMQAIARARDE